MRVRARPVTSRQPCGLRLQTLLPEIHAMPDEAPFIRPAAFKDAVRKLNDKLPVTSVLKSREWSLVPVAIRERAFFSAQVENARFLQTARDGIDDFLKSEVEETDGGKALKAGGRERFVRIMREKMAEQGMLVVGPEVGGVTEPTSTGRLRLIFETQTTMANDYAYFKHGNEDPAIRRAFPAQRFIREMPTESPRAVHEAYTGAVRMKDDLAFWLSMNSREIGGFGVPYGPWGFNSGMGVEDVGRAEAIARGLMKPDAPTPPPVPEEGFNADVVASTNGIDPDIMRQLEKALGPKGKKKRDAIQLVPTDAPTPPPVPAVVIPRAATKVREAFEHLAASKPEATPEELRAAMHAAIMEGRPVSDGFTWKLGTRDTDIISKAHESTDFMRRICAPDMVNGVEVKFVKIAGRRPYYAPGDKEVRTHPKIPVSVFVHELSHAIEMQRPAVLARLVEFRAKRTAGESLVSMQTLHPGAGFGLDERVLKDQWRERGGEHYTGKVYRSATGVDKASEILSMGLERLHKDPVGFSRRDPEFFDFILNLTAGLIP